MTNIKSVLGLLPKDPEFDPLKAKLKTHFSDLQWNIEFAESTLLFSLRALKQRYDFWVVDTDINGSDVLSLMDFLKAAGETLRPSHLLMLTSKATKKKSIDPARAINTLEKPVVIEQITDYFNYYVNKTHTPVSAEPVAQPAKAKIDPFLIQIPLGAAAMVIKNLGQANVIGSRTYLTKANEIVSLDVAAEMPFISDQYEGRLTIGTGKITFLALLSKMIGMQVEEFTDEYADAMCEFLNQIYGYCKIKLNEIGYNLKPSIPKTINPKTTVPVKEPLINVVYITETENGIVRMELNIFSIIDKKLTVAA